MYISVTPFSQALGEGMNGYRPIVELMNTNFGIYGMAELSSAGNTYATTGGQFDMPLTIIGAGGTAPNQSLGAEHSQVCFIACFFGVFVACDAYVPGVRTYVSLQLWLWLCWCVCSCCEVVE